MAGAVCCLVLGLLLVQSIDDLERTERKGVQAMAGFDLVQMIEGQEAVIAELSAGLETTGRIYRGLVCDEWPYSAKNFAATAKRQQLVLAAARDVRAYLQVQRASEMLVSRRGPVQSEAEIMHERDTFGGPA